MEGSSTPLLLGAAAPPLCCCSGVRSGAASAVGAGAPFAAFCPASAFAAAVDACCSFCCCSAFRRAIRAKGPSVGSSVAFAACRPAPVGCVMLIGTGMAMHFGNFAINGTDTKRRGTIGVGLCVVFAGVAGVSPAQNRVA